MSTGTIRDSAKDHLLETRKAVIASWAKTADLLDVQGENILAAKVGYFAGRLPPVLTDRERLAAQFLQHVHARRSTSPVVLEPIRRSHPTIPVPSKTLVPSVYDDYILQPQMRNSAVDC